MRCWILTSAFVAFVVGGCTSHGSPNANEQQRVDKLERQVSDLKSRLAETKAAPPSTPNTAGPTGNSGARTRRASKGNIELVYIPAGEFTMGGPGDEEKPQRKVFLDAYTIGKTPVTVGQFKAYCADGGPSFSSFTAPPWGWIDNHPMVNVNWQQAHDFCVWAGGDLPTEAQWEKAARGNDGNEYPWGSQFDNSRLWCSKTKIGDAKSTAPVGSFPSGASPFGCLDMAGNVWQWCADYYGPSYSGQPDRNPIGPGFGTTRVLRGGSWRYRSPAIFRSADRYGDDPADQGGSGYGFRLAGPP